MDEACDMEADAAAGGTQQKPRKKFYCEICGKHYDDKFKVVHMQMHDGAEKFNCAICNKVFPNQESLWMHSKAHQDPRNVSVISVPAACPKRNNLVLRREKRSFFCFCFGHSILD